MFKTGKSSIQISIVNIRRHSTTGRTAQQLLLESSLLRLKSLNSLNSIIISNIGKNCSVTLKDFITD